VNDCLDEQPWCRSLQPPEEARSVSSPHRVKARSTYQPKQPKQPKQPPDEGILVERALMAAR